jgi:flagellar hook-associated protein 3 FlgL
MRVTDRMVFDAAAINASRSRERSQVAMQQVSTGTRVVHPGDDPTAAGLIVRGRQTQARLDAIAKTAARAGDEIDAADSTLQDLGNVLARARELAVQLGNDTYSASDRKAGAAEVDVLFQQTVALMNKDVNGRFIFGGNKDQTPPFDAAGNYTGDTAVRQAEVAPGVLEDASVRADVMVKGAGGGVDLFATLKALSAAMSSNNGDAIRGALPDLETATHQLSDGTAKVGAMGDAFATAQTLLIAGRDAAVASVSREADADIIQASSDLALANQALNATLTASAQSFRLSLVDKLG